MIFNFIFQGKELLYNVYTMNNLSIIDTRKLFRKNTDELINLLKLLNREQWLKPTCYPEWTVKDIAAHLLQSGMHRLSKQRDGFPTDKSLPPLSFNEIMDIISNSNDSWQEMFASISPELIINLLTHSEYDLCTFFENLSLSGQAPFSVAWAGETVSENWFDMAREFTERWHHHQQIREAVGAPPRAQAEYLNPVLKTLMRAVPYWYSELTFDDGTQIHIEISGEAGGIWILLRNNNLWELKTGFSETPATAEIKLSEDTAWRFLTRTINSSQAADLIQFSGNLQLARNFLRVKAIMMND